MLCSKNSQQAHHHLLGVFSFSILLLKARIPSTSCLRRLPPGPHCPATKRHYSWMSNSVMTHAASLAVGPLEAWVIAALRDASSVPEWSSRHFASCQRNTDAIEREGLPLATGGSFCGIHVWWGRSRQTSAPPERLRQQFSIGWSEKATGAFKQCLYDISLLFQISHVPLLLLEP